VRSRLLAIITARLVQNGVVARVDGLDYNLFTRTVHLSGVTLATPSAAATPFFSANDVRATFPLRTFFGHLGGAMVLGLAGLASKSSHAQAPARRPDGPAINEPAKPLSLAIGRARVGNFAFAWTDEQAKTRQPGISLDLTSDGGDLAGPLTMTGPTSVRVGDRETAATALDGRLSWNDRDLALHALALRAPEGTLRADGTIASLLADPRINLTIVSDVDVAAASRWVTPERPIAGTAHAEAHLAGPMAKPDIDLTTLHASIAGGSVAAKGRVSIDGPGTVRAEWKRVDVPSLVDIALGPGTRWSPAARLDGSLDAKWTTPDLDHVQVTADSRASGDAAGATRVELRGRQFTVAVDDLAALGARATAAIDGTLNTTDFSQSTMRGSVAVKAEDAAKLTRALVQAGLIQSAPAIRGTTSAAFTVAEHLAPRRSTDR
jgi:hypothetical protein